MCIACECRIALDLVDGVHCDLPDRVSCVSEEGFLTYTGIREPTLTSDRARYMGYDELMTGDPLCGLGL